MCLQLHGIVQNAADLHRAGFAHAVEQEMARAAYAVAGSTGRLAAKEEVIGSAIVGDFRPQTAAGKVWIFCDLLDGRSNELSVAPQGLWAKIILRPGKNARDVALRLRSNNDFHGLIRRSWQLWT